LTQRGDRVEVQFHNGATADADVVVRADGIHSTVREAILGPESPRFSGQVAYRGLVPAARVAALGIEVVASSWWGRTITSFIISLAPARATSIGS
jgi:salicylate hydroxylase